MSRNTIRLEAIDPIEIYGAANRNLEALCSYFPNLKVTARGNDIHLDGSSEDIENFKNKLGKKSDLNELYSYLYNRQLYFATYLEQMRLIPEIELIQ